MSTQAGTPRRTPAPAPPRAGRRSPGQMPVSGPFGMGQLMTWQVAAALGVVAVVMRPGPARWVLAAATGLSLLLTVPRWRHRWAFQWLLTAWGFSRLHRAGQAASVSPLRVLAVPLRGGAEAGIVHDGAGFAVVVAVDPRRPGQDGRMHGADLTAGTLARLLDLRDDVVSAVQVVVCDDLPAGNPGSRAAAAYRELGYHRVPRSRSAWVVLRHEPTAPGHAASGTVSGPDLHASLTRALAGSGLRAVDLLGELGLNGRLLDAEAVRGALGTDMASPGLPDPGDGSAAGARALRWASWEDGTRGHVTFWLRGWPSGGLRELHQALSGTPVLSSDSAVAMTRRGGRLALIATIRVTFRRDADLAEIKSAVAAAALSCGARLVAMDGDHRAGAAATLPTGRAPVPACRWIRCHYGSPDTPLSVGAGGLALGPDADGKPVVLPFFRSEGMSAAVLGDPALPRMLALRALASGARVRVVTARPGGWLRLQSSMRIPEEQMSVVRPGTPPPCDGHRMAPWMIIDDTGSPAVGSRAWQAAVAVPREVRAGTEAFSGLDAVLLRGITDAQGAVLAAAMRLPAPEASTLTRLRGDSVGVVMPGWVSSPLFVLTGAEAAALSASLRGDEEP